MFTDINFAMFPGRPWRFMPSDWQMFASRWTDWRGHACAPLLEGMLDARRLDELDVVIVESGPSLAVETPLDVRFLAAHDDPEEQARELAMLASDLDWTVAWRVRDLMIQAALEACGLAEWVVERAPGPSRRRGAAPTLSKTDWFTPHWAITASTPLLRQFELCGLDARRAMEAVAGMRDAAAEPNWTDIANVVMTLEGGRLHSTSHGNSPGVVEDRDGLDLLLPEQHLPATLTTALTGRRLSELATIASPPPLLRDLDPIIEAIEEHDDPWSQRDPCTPIRLVSTTETLADIPPAALAVVGVTGPLPRTVKPWLTPGLRADGTPRGGDAVAAPRLLQPERFVARAKR